MVYWSVGKRGPKPKGRVDTTWRPELAYAVGLIVADGSLSKNGIHIDFTSKDIDSINNFKKCLNLYDIKTGIKSRSKEKTKKYFRVQFGDTLFHRWLTGIGLSPNKSLSIKSVNIPDAFFFDFLRGEWDGDGTMYLSKDLRWKNSYVVSLGFASGSERFLEWLQKEINKRLQTTGHIHRGKNVLQLRYAKADSKKIITAMFYKKDLPHLKRKFAKAQKIFTMTELQ
jgi:hypothetical protein